MSDAPLILVDGSSYLYRAFHALPPLTTSKGQPTGAVRGVVAMLKKEKKKYPDSTIVVVFDAKGKTFRDELYGEYKAQRPPMPDDLREQIEPLHACVLAMGFPMLVHPGVEADDVIGTLACEASSRGKPVLISTGDKDMAQLVDDNVGLINTMSGSQYDAAGVEEKFGVPPSLIIDYLAIIGDKSDNIPGIPGVGPKSATPILQALGGLDDIYANLDAIADLEFRGAKKMAEKLIEHKESAYLSYTLATIKLDVELDIQASELKNSEPDIAALRQLYTELEFRGWVTELAAPSNEFSLSQGAEAISGSATTTAAAEDSAQVQAAPAAPAQEVDYETVLSEASLDAWIEKLKGADVFAFDTETTSLNYMQARVVGLSFAIEPYKAAYVPLDHDYPGAPTQLSADLVFEKLKPVLMDSGKTLVGQNIKYDISVLAKAGVEIGCKLQDTMLESYVLDSVAGRHDMDSLALRNLDRETIHFEDIAGKGAKQITFNQIDLEQAGPYAAEDADVTIQLHQTLHPKLSEHPSLLKVYEEIEIPLIPVLSRIERTGAFIDSKAMQKQSSEIAIRLIELEAEVHELAGQPFNLASPKQLQHILYEKMQLPVLKKTPKGQPSTAEDVLKDLAAEHELPALIVQYRGLAKLKSTYTDKLPLMVDEKTGRLHTSYHQAVAATGRLSSTEPNLQNIPIRTEEGRRIRKAFIAEKGSKMLAADYSQIELRIMAHLSKDAVLQKAFADNLDVHSATAAEVFGVELDQVTTDHRRSAKAINFGLMYGMSAFGLAKQLHIGRKEAQQYMDLYFERYPGVADFMEQIREDAREKGYVETLFGRRLYLPQINARNGQHRAAAERTAINAPMQGTAADIIKRAMLSVDAWLLEEKPPVKMIMQVHDELVFEVEESYLETASKKVIQLMESAAELSVPLVVEAGSGDNWQEAH
jgi:DNA polymerase-1